MGANAGSLTWSVAVRYYGAIRRFGVDICLTRETQILRPASPSSS